MNIYDIAERAGVSIATVSRVINGSGAVSLTTQRRVLDVIAEMGYKPNIFAQGLNTNSMRVLGVLTTDVTDLYYAAAVRSLEQGAKAQGYDILLSCAEDSVADKIRHMALLLEKRVDGIVLVGSTFKEARGNAHILQAAQRAPVVLLNSSLKGPGIYSVYCDDAAGVATAMEHLVAGGRRNIGYIYDVTTSSGLRKLSGYQRAVRRRNLPALALRTEPGIDGGAAAAQALRERRVDAIVCATDELAVGALKALARAGVSVPGDVAVIGYDNSLLARCATPELASVDGKVALLSACALDTMLKVLRDGMAPEKTVVTPELMLRESAIF